MNKVIKIILIVFLILILLVGIFGYITYVQAKKLIALTQDEKLSADLEGLAQGQCDKLPSIETKLESAKKDLKSGCKNPIIKYLIEKYSPEKGICNTEDIGARIDSSLIQMRAYCSTNSS